MLDSIRNIFSIPELRKRVIFYPPPARGLPHRRADPQPGLNAAALQEFWQSQKGSLFGFVDLFSGRNMSE